MTDVAGDVEGDFAEPDVMIEGGWFGGFCL